jgi:hypothetical protein
MKKILVKHVLVETFFLGETFFVVKSFPWKQDAQHFGRKMVFSKIFLLQNHFLGNSLDEKKFGRNFFCRKFLFGVNYFCSKIISSETG